MKVGMIGCGNISAQYLKTFPTLPDVELVAVADLDMDRARAVAAEHEGVRALTVDELIADAEVETVLNLTIPAAHAEIDLRAIAAGKNVHAEKPFAVTADEGAEVLAAAAAAGVLVGSAPDTVLGTGTQTARQAIDDGLIGTPISAVATMMTPGHERWHPNPDFYYVPGGGPLLDMGPYYIHSLVTLLGPVSAVIGASSRLRAERTIGSGAREGEVIPVTTDTHVTGVLIHSSGALSTLVMSFDAVATHAHPIEVHGTLGSLSVPDPNRFDGEVSANVLGSGGWKAVPESAGYVGASRGIALQDMATRGERLRASGALGQHALEVMNAMLESSGSGQRVEISSTLERPEAVPLADVRVSA
ncbi:Gfo/Idh/MocA family oxidoreductase [Brachybacterium sp. J144]|uniref:Gfo/Idh/MocA family protein n=1 Tax=Brachybacterium sp. J144 TaxID=3116487 RepID=UPI002E7802F3|nr:Gfo/Idh/MocA family oxidoreductase [Brachybacterium sp. J144]MEE1650209.1 Gfo/Idh/MocA family oxidoreductase [Brachybacterium sp. J144]